MRRAIVATAIAVCHLANYAPFVRAFVPDGGTADAGRWSFTASGSTGSAGDPITLTWSFAPDGTSVNNGEGGLTTNSLISFLDGKFGSGPGGSDLTLRPWFSFFADSFNRWSELGGVTYAYEPNDVGGTVGPGANGLLGSRGDVRIAGIPIDGTSNVLAFSFLPSDGGDMVLDVGDGDFFGSSSGGHVSLRNTIMHEHGHGLGFLHVESTSRLLMEPFISTAFDGPQLDEVRGIHFFYGDALEKSNGGLGNDTAALATSFGVIGDGGTAAIGTGAITTSQAISTTATDFISIDNALDVDFFSYSVDGPSFLEVVLTPRGGVFDQGVEGSVPTTFDANARLNLQLDLFDRDGVTILASANAAGLGGVETLADVSLDEAGQYFVRVSAVSEDTVQLYDMTLSLAAHVTTFSEADFNQDGSVDAADLAQWESDFGLNGDSDADQDLDSDGADYLIWQQQFGELSASFSSVAAVPEPSAWTLAAFAAAAALGLRSMRQ